MPSSAPTAPRSRTKRATSRRLRRDARNFSPDRPDVRLQLADDLPDLPRKLADEADVYDLMFLAHMLMRTPTHDPEEAA